MFKTEQLRKFYGFLTERQNIWHKRFVEKLPPPWTDDPILQANHCCNVYRELDKGTKYVTEAIIPSSTKPEDVLFRILLYRMFNEINSYRAMKPVLTKFTAYDAANILLKRQQNGHHVFRNAWLTAGTGLHGPGSKIQDYCRVAEGVYINRRQFYKTMKSAKGIKAGWDSLRQVKWMGGFMGYQVALDFSYIPWMDWEDDGWVYVGPGAKKGIYWLKGESPITDHDLRELEFEQKRPIDFEKYIRVLQRKQGIYFKKFGLNFRKWDGKELDQHNIEFALCEFNKVLRAGHGGKRKRYVYNEGKGIGVSAMS